MNLSISRVYFPVTALGPGRRLGVWFQGCTIGCHGCMSRDTWDSTGGTTVPVERIVELWQQARAAGADGLTISGGEPSQQPEALMALLRAVRCEPSPGPATDVLLYTGYELAELTQRVPVVPDLLDAVITGPFDARRPTTLIWRGSANQRLHPLTELGRQRYERFIDHRPARPPMQIAVDCDTIRYIGVPRAGDIAALDRRLRANGIEQKDVSWRR